jgi:hypothetical protein
MHYFAEVLTSDLMSAAPDSQMVLYANLNDSGYISSVVSNTVTAGAGLGAASSIAAGESTNYTHSFGPSDSATGILSSQLSVMTSGSSASSSFAEITLDDNFWASRAMSFQVLGGQVDATLFQLDGELVVNVSATGGDLDLVWSMFRVNYEIDATRLANGDTVMATSGGDGGISQAIPEPGAATLFGAGMLIVGSAVRRRTNEA